MVVSAGPPCQCETLSLHPHGAGKGWLLGTDWPTEFQHWPEGGTHQRELSLPDSFNPTSINVFLHHCLPEGWGLLCQHCAAQKQRSFPGQGTNRAEQDEAVHSHSFKWHRENDLPKVTVVMLDLLFFCGAGCGTIQGRRGCSHSFHMSLSLALATLVPGCTTHWCQVRGLMVPQFPLPCFCHNRPRVGKANPAFLGRGAGSED